MQKAYGALAPGGYLEFQDVELQVSDDGSFSGTALEEIHKRITEATAKMGVLWTNVPRYPGWLREAGFSDVTEARYRWPSNPFWPSDEKEKRIGRCFLHQMDDAGLLEAVCTKIFIGILHWTPEGLKTLLDAAKRDMRDERIRAYSPM
jgi:hypothetical protein